MGKTSRAVCLLTAIAMLAACRNGVSARSSIFSGLPKLTVAMPAADGRILSPAAGEIVELPAKLVKEAGLGRHVAIRTSVEYAFGGKTETAEYTTVIGNLSRIQAKKGAVEKGQVLGTVRGAGKGGQAVMLVAADSPNSYLVCSTAERPENRYGKWWFSGNFLLDDIDNLWLSYLPETSPSAALARMLDGGKTNRYLLELSLADHPGPIPAELAEELTAYAEERTGLEEIESMQTFREGGNLFYLFWPAGFARFLRDEYTPGNTIRVFSRLIPCDTDYRKTYIFAREFLQESLETLYTERQESYTQ